MTLLVISLKILLTNRAETTYFFTTETQSTQREHKTRVLSNMSLTGSDLTGFLNLSGLSAKTPHQSKLDKILKCIPL
jgi:hypothetical protein